MELLERQTYIDELSQLAKEVCEGSGKTVIVSGEAGIGKTSLIRHFTDNLNSDSEILWGACDDLFTPRPLGPVYDIAYQVKSDLVKKLEAEDNRFEIFSLFLNYLQNGSNLKVVVFEDIHWADEATLDLIKYLARRINRTKSILVLSYRDEEIGRDNLLRSTFGDLPYSEIKRIRLYPLSENAVSDLLRKKGISNNNLYRITGGNPFYVTEMLVYKNEDLPSSIKDAVIARTASLDEDTKSLLEIISVIPTKTEIELLRKLHGNAEEHIDRLIDKAIIVKDRNLVSFRHELSRLAILDTIPEMKRIQIHRKVLEYLLGNENQLEILARILHHAVQAGDKDVIIKYAPLAARQASVLGAHSLAAENYCNALRYCDNLPPEQLIELYEGRSYECYLTGQVEEAIQAGEKVNELLKICPDAVREGENYRRMSRMYWYNCQDKKGEEYLNRGIEILEKLPLNRCLGMAYSNKSQTYEIREDKGTTIKWGEKALDLAKKLGDPEIEAHALNNIGSAKLMANDESGEADLKRSIEISMQHNYFEHAVRAYINLGGRKLQQRNLSEAEKYYSKGIDFSNEKDLYVFSLCLAGHHSKVMLHYGKWDEAIERANSVLNKASLPPGNKIMPLTVIGIIRTRRNDPGAIEVLDKLIDLAFSMGENEKIVSVGAARAEYYWLRGEIHTVVDELQSVYSRVKKTKNCWAIGEIAYWLWKAGNMKTIPEGAAEPYYLQMKGKWREAAGIWEKLGCPYEKALSLSEGDEQAMKEAVEIFDRLGASATSSRVKQQMRENGIRKIPKGPRASTKANPGGLTERQVDVLKLLTRGMSNSEIASSLFISPKTVDHHISAIFAKLNLHSRTEAAAYVRTNGMLSKGG